MVIDFQKKRFFKLVNELKQDLVMLETKDVSLSEIMVKIEELYDKSYERNLPHDNIE